MKVVVIGATGHVGGYLVPRLVRAGHRVVAVSRGTGTLYRDDPAWAQVERVSADRAAEDAAGSFGPRIAALQPDAVIDMVCFTPESAAALRDALRGREVRLLSCGSIWTHGALVSVPARETDPRHPWGEYGLGKLAIERLLLADGGTAEGVRSTVLHPGHISGPGWPVINPIGNLDLDVWERLATGGRVVLPGLGLETLHHVHADDVAQAFERALERPEAVTGRSFHVVSERALTLRGFAESVAGWFGREAVLEYAPFDAFSATVSPESAATSWEHVARSHSMSIEAAREAFGYVPVHASLDAARESVERLAADGRVALPF